MVSSFNVAGIGDDPKVGKFRQALPQILACMTKNLLLFDLGLSYGFPTIVIPVLLGFAKDTNPNETIHFTASQASWYGSVGLLTEIFASLLSGWFTETFGRRRTMFIVNLPHIAAWIMMYRAESVAEVFAAGILLGIGVGLMETACITYVGEISHHSLRGFLLTVSNLSCMLGMSSTFLAGSLMLWRHVALICMFVPLVALVLICFVPETPYWLLTRNRNDEAMKSLQWLRGWVSPPYVKTEYTELREFVTQSMACAVCKREHIECSHYAGFWTRSLDIRQANTMRPLCVVIVSFVLSHCCYMTAMRPYLVQIVTVYRIPVSPSYYMAISGGVELAANVAMVFLVKHVGKRPLFLVTTGIATCCAFVLAIDAFRSFPLHTSSFDQAYVLHAQTLSQENTLAMVFFLLMTFFAAMAMGVPWMLLSELYPIRVRAAACGVSASFSYLCMFGTTKLYLGMETSMSIGGVLLLYFALAVITWILVYIIMPETEGRTLVDIETHFSKASFRLNDRRISRQIWQPQIANDQSTHL